MIKTKLIFFCFLIQIATAGFTQDFWTPIPYPDSTFGYALNVEHSDYIFFGNFENPAGLYRSNPEVIDWEYSNNTKVKAYDMAFNSNDVMFLTCADYIFSTSDFGNTFDSLHHGNDGIFSVEINENDDIWVGCWGQILFSNDNGITWDTMMESSTSEAFYDFAFGLNGEVYAVSTHFTAPLGGFYRSLDNGTTWENTGLQSNNAHCIAVNSYGDIFVGCYFSGVYRSTNNGLTWTNVKYDIDASSIVIDNENKIFSANAGQNFVHNPGVHYSEDNGQTWDTLDGSGLSNKVVSKIYLNENGFLYALSRWQYGHQLFRSNNPIVGINDTEFENMSISVFPNPCQNTIEIRFNTPLTQQYHYNILDITATIMQEGVIQSNMQNSLDVQSLLPGVYILQLISDKSRSAISTVFIKQ